MILFINPTEEPSVVMALRDQARSVRVLFTYANKGVVNGADAQEVAND